MAVYYYPLWKTLEESGMTKKELCEKAEISATTLAKMNRNEYVALDVINRLAYALDCGIPDLMTNKPPTDESQLTIVALHSELLSGLKAYMEEYGATIKEISTKTTMSVNTVKKFLRGNRIHEYSYRKLLALGNEYTELLAKKPSILFSN